jgi:LacI family transcriptional regulator, galactose operon repressor
LGEVALFDAKKYGLATFKNPGMSAIAAVQDKGLNVPRDVAIVGIDDIEAAQICRPSLTTVTSNPKATGEAAANILIDMMSGRTPKQQKPVIQTNLVVRNSTVSSTR